MATPQKYASCVTLAQQWGLDPAWCQAHADWHSRKWFVVEDAPGRVCTRLGARPGDPAADLVFCLGVLVFQWVLLEELQALELFPVLEACSRRIFPGGDFVTEAPFVFPTFMDDIAVPICAVDSICLLESVQQAATVVVKVALFRP